MKAKLNSRKQDPTSVKAQMSMNNNKSMKTITKIKLQKENHTHELDHILKDQVQEPIQHMHLQHLEWLLLLLHAV